MDRCSPQQATTANLRGGGRQKGEKSDFWSSHIRICKMSTFQQTKLKANKETGEYGLPGIKGRGGQKP